MSVFQKLKYTPVSLRAALLGIILSLGIGLLIGKFWPEKVVVEEVDPHEGQVFINDGSSEVWLTPWVGAEISVLTEDNFLQSDGEPVYSGDTYEVRKGIDVSVFQGNIDFQQVKDAGYDFVFVRAGFRGYGTKGSINEDENFLDNIEKARKAGLDVGAYFFSQAITVEEAIEEAEFVLNLLDGCPLDLPIIFDWEANNVSDSRTCGINKVFLSEAALQFCKTIEENGYDAGVYFYRQLGYYVYDLGNFGEYTLWLSEPGTYPSFYYAVDFWQYNIEMKVPGIDIITDVNYQFIKKQNDN